MSDYHCQALDLAQSGDWDQAHILIQSHSDPLACLIHGYLHWQQGDRDNARYWYNQAEQTLPDHSLLQEFKRLCAQAAEN